VAARRASTKKLILISAIASLMATASVAQTTVTTTTGTANAAVQIEPQYRTKIKSYVAEHKVRPLRQLRRLSLAPACPQTLSCKPFLPTGVHL